MPINIQDYLLGRIPVGRKIDIPAYLMAKAASGGGIQEITGTLPLYVRSRASQILKNYIIYGTASGAGVETENLWDGTFYQGSIQSGAWKIRITTRNIPIEAGMTYSLKLYGELPSICDFAFVVRQDNSIIYDSGWNDTSTFVYIVPQDVEDYYAEIIIKRKTEDIISPSDAKSLGNLTFTKSSTPPPSYIPHGYKLLMTVTSNGTTTDYPIYIGDSKLMEGEYVDYEEQKIYKRGENEFPFAEKGTFAFGDDGTIISDGEGKFVVSMPSAIPSNTRSELISLNRPYTIPQPLDVGGEFVFYLGDNIAKSNLLLVFYDSDGVQIDTWECTSTWRIITRYTYMVGKTIAYVGVRATSTISGKIELTPMFSKSTNLTEYVPYLQPTDPPVPLPDITLPQGEVTIDIEGDPKPQTTVKGRIEQI